MKPRHVLLASMALAALAFLGWRATRPSSSPPTTGGAAAMPASGARPESGAGDTVPAARTPPAAAEPEPASDASAPDPLGVLVYGAVLDELGQRVASGTLTFTDAEGTERRGSIDVAGSYTALGLAAGAWTLTLRAEGHYPYEGELEIPSGADRHRHDLALQRAVALRVRFVTPDGTLLAEASEAIRRDDDLRPVAVATIDPPPVRLPDISGRNASYFGVGKWSGRARWNRDKSIPAGFDGLLVLERPPPVHVSAVLRDVVLATQLVGPGTDALDFTLAPEELAGQLAGLRLTVVDAITGAPISSGSVDLSHSQRAGGGRPLGEDGGIEFAGELPGLMELETHVPGYELVKKRVRLFPGETVDCTLALHPVVTLEGRVVGPDGAGVSVSMTTVPLHQLSMPVDVETRSGFASDSEGRFEAHVAANETMIVVNDRAFAIVPLFVDARAAVGELELRVAPGTPVTLRCERAGSGVLRFVLTDSAGRPFHTRRMLDEHELRLLPGSYRLRVGGDESHWHDAPFTVGAEPMTLTFPEAPR